MTTDNSSLSQPESVLIVEDDEGLCSLLAEETQTAGYEVGTTGTAEEARVMIDRQLPDLVVSDLRLPGADGMELLRHVQGLHIPPAFIIITAFGSIPQAVEALKTGADNFLPKPIDLEHFRITIDQALRTRRLRQQVQQFKNLLGEDHFHGMIGRCQSMQVLFDNIRQVARGAGPVLITGESGVGKELVAQAIHEESERSSGPFIPVNCAGMPSELLESEFFGHEKGAFTGAHEQRQGLFVEADGGTLLLDEIAEMPSALQAKLLRVLQENMIRPVGSNNEIEVDVRILASTNRNLEVELEEERFREDLFYRLETFTLPVPPLRERGDDLDLLAAHFVDRFSSQMDKDVQSLSPEAVRMLQAYSFPGNVRELENAIERAVTYCTDDEITPDHLPRRIRDRTPSFDPAWDESAKLLDPTNGQLPTLETIEQRYIRYVLDELDGNKRRASEVLGISRRTLYRRLDLADTDKNT